MSALTIQSWTKNLGQTHEYLLSESLIPDNELIELFAGDDQVYLEPEKGISMTFWDETGRLESFAITLMKVVPGDSEYRGELPFPYELNMNKSKIRDLFGDPFQSSGPVKMPHPVGRTGGWDGYKLDQSLYPNTKVVFHYHESTQVDYVAFSLIDKGHD